MDFSLENALIYNAAQAQYCERAKMCLQRYYKPKPSGITIVKVEFDLAKRLVLVQWYELGYRSSDSQFRKTNVTFGQYFTSEEIRKIKIESILT